MASATAKPSSVSEVASQLCVVDSFGQIIQLSEALILEILEVHGTFLNSCSQNVNSLTDHDQQMRSPRSVLTHSKLLFSPSDL